MRSNEDPPMFVTMPEKNQNELRMVPVGACDPAANLPMGQCFGYTARVQSDAKMMTGVFSAKTGG